MRNLVLVLILIFSILAMSTGHSIELLISFAVLVIDALDSKKTH